MISSLEFVKRLSETLFHRIAFSKPQSLETISSTIVSNVSVFHKALLCPSLDRTQTHDTRGRRLKQTKSLLIEHLSGVTKTGTEQKCGEPIGMFSS